MNRRVDLSLSYRMALASRVLAAIVAGYAFTSVVTWWLELVWSTPPVQAVLAATMLSFTVYGVVVVRMFCVRTATRAWVELMAATLIIASLCVLLR